MSHDHSHDKEHDEGPPSEYEIMSRAMQELLVEKGVISAEQIRQRMEKFEQDFPYCGARVIAHAWADPAFRKRLLEDGKGGSWGFSLGEISTKSVGRINDKGEWTELTEITIGARPPQKLMELVVRRVTRK